jgi:hypothetical protein
VQFAESGVSLLVGTCSAALVPDCVRGVGVRVWPGACQLTVLLPVATSVQTIDNLRANPRLAVTLSHVPTHRTIQVKGSVRAIRDGGEDDRAMSRHYVEALAEDFAWLGQPSANTLRLGHWPSYAIDLDIAMVFAQTPGPVAGMRMPMPDGGRW